MRSETERTSKRPWLATRRVLMLLSLAALCLVGAVTALLTIAGSSGDARAADEVPYTFQATLDPYFINQSPDFFIRSMAAKDVVMQQRVLSNGAAGWHTHPGPSFMIVVRGEMKIQRFSEKSGCTETPVLNDGDAFYQGPNVVHRPVVLSDDAVVLVTRFNIPVDGAFTDKSPNDNPPDCPL